MIVPNIADLLPTTHSLLILEASPAEGQKLAEGMQAFGYHVLRASTPKEIDQLLHEHAVDALLVDLDRTDLASGTGWLEDLQAVKPYTTPLLALASSNDPHLQLRAVRAGCNAFFVKPFSIQALADKVETLVNPPELDPYRVLVVEDSRTQAHYLRRLLESAGMTVQVVMAPLETLDLLPVFRPDLILMDMYMPGCDGPDLAALIRLNPAYLSIPIVFHSTETDASKQLEALRQGADDFLTKNIRPEHLISSVRIRAERTRILRGLMLKDSLTGLFNHTTLKARLQEEITLSQRQGSSLCFAMVDIDHFKIVNDTHGHGVGDQVIRALSTLLQHRMRKTDILGRYGGEEFGLILPNTTIDAGECLMEGLREAFKAIPHMGATGPFRVSFSAGVAPWAKGIEAAVLNELADAALYQAKRGGRDQILVAGRVESQD